MFKRLFWIALGVTIGILTVAKAQSYVRANTPDKARQFVLGPDQDHVAVRTLKGLLADFTAAQRGKEEELNQRFASRHE